MALFTSDQVVSFNERFKNSTPEEIVSFAFSNLFGFKSEASIDLDISRARTISIQFLVIFCLIFALFGSARSNINTDDMRNKSRIFT